MNLNNLTIKAQEVVQRAQQIAIENGQQAMENGHLLKALLDVDEHVAPFILKKLGVNYDIVKQAAERIVQSYAAVNGGEQYMSRELANTLQRANVYLKKLDDEYVALEHLLLALTTGQGEIARLLKDSGLAEKELLLAIRDLRQGQHVTSSSAENRYNALNKYAANLNDLARSGKLDPVIGREEEIRRLLHILARRTKNNPILIGQAGVGKTAIVEGLAHRIVNGDIPEDLKDKEIYALDMGDPHCGGQIPGRV